MLLVAACTADTATNPYPRHQTMAAATEGLIYVLGGYGTVYLVGGVPGGTSALAYNAEANTWTSLAPMNQLREHFAVVVYEGELWALGGRWNGVMLDSVEIFDPNAATWREGPR